MTTTLTKLAVGGVMLVVVLAILKFVFGFALKFLLWGVIIWLAYTLIKKLFDRKEDENA